MIFAFRFCSMSLPEAILHTNVLARVATPAILLPVFAVTLFISAGLMFFVEPMVAKMVLPRLGGSPAVWSTCLVFFQAVLLLGYAYAHVLTRLSSRLTQILIHIGLILPLAGFVLPLDLGAGAPSSDQPPALWLLLRLALMTGPLVFAISTTAPLLQSWFSDLDHDGAGDPYFLYAMSNAGSLLSLLAYPLLVEPTMSLTWQATVWSCSFGILALGIALCALLIAIYRVPHNPTFEDSGATHRTSLRQRLWWTALAFVPSSLLLGVTTHITTDIASAPLLWVVPLALYLLSFILAFMRRPPLRHSTMVRVLPLLLIPLVVTAAPGLPVLLPLPLLLLLNLGCLFAVGMVCHGELARLRPPARQLTEFYFFLSLGGVLGGVFNALLAPLIFPDVWEYSLALIAACLMRPAAPVSGQRGLARDIMLPTALLGFMLLIRIRFPIVAGGILPLLLEVMFGYVLPALVLLNFSPRRWRFGLGIAVFLFAAAATGANETIATYRSFFGVYRVEAINDGRSHALVLTNGTTLHGVKSLAQGEETTPMAYYSEQGPFGRFFATLAPNPARHVAVIGLGTGELACYAKPGWSWTFYEIDPVVEQIARDPHYFQFLANCGNTPDVVLGDARQRIADAPDGHYDVLVIDAFSSDSIPMHLLTREAMSLYLRKLAPNGRLLFHISSRTLDLRPVVGALAADAGVQVRLMFDNHAAPSGLMWRRLPTLVVAVAGPGGNLDDLRQTDGWIELPANDTSFLWTDQRSDLLRVIRFGF